VTLAGVLALLAFATGVAYEFHSTPVTMVMFLAGGSGLLVMATALLGWAFWHDVTARLQSITSKRFAAGEVIFRQGDDAEHIFVITKGKVEAVFSDPVKGEVVLGQLGPPEFFGETAILTQSPRQATVRAVEEVESLMVHRTDFLRLYGSLPRLRAAIEAQQSRRKAMLNGQSRG
jgi:CRP-like cAMP-binding protein